MPSFRQCLPERLGAVQCDPKAVMMDVSGGADLAGQVQGHRQANNHRHAVDAFLRCL